jgi:transposase
LGFYTVHQHIGEILMEARTVNNPLPAASHDETVRCVLAIELSKKSWIVAVNTPLSDKISRHTLEAVIGRGFWS